nr:unnamed protein product [Callosobruchus chinensis]
MRRNERYGNRVNTGEPRQDRMPGNDSREADCRILEKVYADCVDDFFSEVESGEEDGKPDLVTPIVHAKVAGVSIGVLIDSGSQVSAVSDKFLKMIKHDIPKLLVSNVALDQAEEKWIARILAVLRGDMEVSTVERDRIKKWYVCHGGILFRRGDEVNVGFRLCVPLKQVRDLTNQQNVDIGHFGAHKTYAHMSRTFHWPKMKKHVRQVIAGCDICQKTKISPTLHGAMNSVLVDRPGISVCVDLMGPLPPSRGGVVYLLAFIDSSSKHCRLYALKRATTRAILDKLLKDYVPNVQKPNAILSDNGTQFRSREWSRRLGAEGILVKFTSTYYTQGNQTERLNREIGRLPGVFRHENHKKWSFTLEDVEMCINNVVHESTGFCPNMLQFGRKLENNVCEIINFPKVKNGDQAISLESLRADEGKIKKLFALFEGPFYISKVIGPNSYEICYVNGEFHSIQNIVNLKVYNVMPNSDDRSLRETESIIKTGDTASADTHRDLVPEPPATAPDNASPVLELDIQDDEYSVFLGDDPSSQNKSNFELHKALCTRWSHIMCHGLEKDKKLKLLERYPLPNNCLEMSAPLINPEVSGVLSNPHLQRDEAHLGIQRQLNTGLAALGRGVNIILDDKENIPKEIKEHLLISLGDAGRILSDLSFNISTMRRNLIMPSLNKTVKDLVASTIPLSFLFGSDIGEKIKEAKIIERAKKDLKPEHTPTQPSTSSSYYRRPQMENTRQGVKTNQTSLNRKRPGTYKLWWQYCQTTGTPIYEAEANHVISFLQGLFDANKYQFGSFNSHRSALSLILGEHVHKDSRIPRFMRGISKLRPSRPKYNCTWDPQHVIAFLGTWENSQISLQHLSYNVATLLALVTGQRIQTISLIRPSNLMESPSSIQILITDQIKTSNINKLQPCLQIPFFLEDPSICPATALKHYLNVHLSTINKL